MSELSSCVKILARVKNLLVLKKGNKNEGKILLEHLITSKTRIKLLLKFFANPGNKGYLRELAKEFAESTNAVRVELNRLAQADLLKCEDEGRTKVYSANEGHTLFPEISSMVHKFLGIDILAELIESKVRALGQVQLVAIIGDYAQGIDSGLIQVMIFGESLDTELLARLQEKAQELLGKNISVQILPRSEIKNWQANEMLVVWGDKL